MKKSTITIFRPRTNSEEIYEILNITKKKEVTLLMIDFNANVGETVLQGITGRCGLGQRNQRAGCFFYVEHATKAGVKCYRNVGVSREVNGSLLIRDLKD